MYASLLWDTDVNAFCSDSELSLTPDISITSFFCEGLSESRRCVVLEMNKEYTGWVEWWGSK